MCRPPLESSTAVSPQRRKTLQVLGWAIVTPPSPASQRWSAYQPGTPPANARTAASGVANAGAVHAIAAPFWAVGTSTGVAVVDLATGEMAAAILTTANSGNFMVTPVPSGRDEPRQK